MGHRTFTQGVKKMGIVLRSTWYSLGLICLFWFCLFTNYHHCLGFLVISGLPLPENQNVERFTIAFKLEFRIQLSSKTTSGTESKLWRFSSAAAGWKPPLISPCNSWITRGSPLFIINRYSHLSIKARISQHSDLDDKPPGSLRDGRHRTPSAPLCLLDPLKACKRTFLYNKFEQKESKSNVQIYTINMKDDSPQLLTNSVQSWVERVLHLRIGPLQRLCCDSWQGLLRRFLCYVPSDQGPSPRSSAWGPSVYCSACCVPGTWQ